MSDEVKPWTIRGVPPEVRNAALSAAKRSGMGVGEWLDRAIRHYVQHEKNSTLEAPQHPLKTANSGDVYMYSPEDATKEAAELVGLISELAAAGAPPPKGVAQQAYGLIRERLKALKTPTKAISAPYKTEK